MSSIVVRWSKLTVLCGLMAFLSIAHLTLHQPQQKNVELWQSSNWRQPALLDKTFATLISQSNWRLDYQAIEPILWQVSQDGAGGLVPSPALEERLQQTVSLLPQDIDEKQWRRLSFLMEKSLPSGTGTQFYELVNRYFLYQHDYLIRLSAIQQARGEQRLTLLSAAHFDNRQLQIDYFGLDVALLLFAKKNLTTDYLYQRRKVNSDPSLSSERRKQMLNELQDKYQQMLGRYQ